MKATVQSSRLPRPACVSPASTRSTGRASWRRWSITSPPRVALGAPHRKVAFTVPTGNFGDIFAGYVATRMGLPIDRLVVATNVNDILARTLATGAYEAREVVRDRRRRRWTSRCRRTSSGCCSRPSAAMQPRCAALMASLAQSRRFSIAGDAAGGDPRAVSRRPRRRGRNRRRPSARAWRETGYFVDPHTAVGDRRGREGSARSARSMPMVVLVHRPSGQIPGRRWKPLAACARRCRTGSADLTEASRAHHRACRLIRAGSKSSSPAASHAPRVKESAA